MEMMIDLVIPTGQMNMQLPIFQLKITMNALKK